MVVARFGNPFGMDKAFEQGLGDIRGTPLLAPVKVDPAPGAGSIPGGIFGNLIKDPGSIAPPQSLMALNVDPVKSAKPGLFDQGGFGRNFLMYLLAGKNAPALAQMQVQQQNRERDLEIARQNRTLDRDDYLWRLKQQRANAEPRYFKSGNGDLYRITPDGRVERVFSSSTAAPQPASPAAGQSEPDIVVDGPRRS